VAGSGFVRKNGLIQTQPSKADHQTTCWMKVRISHGRAEATGVCLERMNQELVRFWMSISIHSVSIFDCVHCNLEYIRDCAYVYTYRTYQQIIPADSRILYSNSCSGLSHSFKAIPNRQPLDLFFGRFNTMWKSVSS
jgi:hypothetical protein